MLVLELMQFPLIDEAIAANDSKVRENSADDEADEGEALRSQREPIDRCEGPGTCHHEDVKETELKRRIKAHEAHDWLREKHMYRSYNSLPDEV